MALRMYLGAGGAPYTPGVKKGAWDLSTSTTMQWASQYPFGTASTKAVAVGNLTANWDVLLGRWCSNDALSAGTLAGNINYVLGIRESATGLNGVFHIHIWVTQGSTDNVRGTLLSDSIGVGAWNTTGTGRTEGSLALTSVAIQAGDFIIFEVGYRANATATGQTATINFGNVGTTDLASSSTAVTTNPGWFEFSDTAADTIFGNPVRSIFDNFDDNTVNTAIWSGNFGNAIETGSQATLDMIPSYCIWGTDKLYKLDATGYTAKVLQVATLGTAVNPVCHMIVDSGIDGTFLSVAFDATNNTLNFTSAVAFTDGSPTSITYSSTTHLWWRVATDGTNVLWYTSPDGYTWTQQRALAAPSWVLKRLTGFRMEAGCDSGAGGGTIWDNFNNPKFVFPGQASETDTAQHAVATKSKTIGQASETDTAQSVTFTKSGGSGRSFTLGQANETDTAQSVTHVRAKTLGQASETDTSQHAVATKSKAIGQARETDTAQLVAHVRAKTLGQAVETDTAQHAVATKSKAIGKAAETDTAQSVAHVRAKTLGQASETDTSQHATAAKSKTIGQASETDLAQSVTFTRGHVIGQAVETDTARPVTRIRSKTIGQAVESDSSFPCSFVRGHTIGQAVETDTARPVTRIRSKAIGQAVELDSAQHLARAIARSFVIGIALETDIAIAFFHAVPNVIIDIKTGVVSIASSVPTVIIDISEETDSVPVKIHGAPDAIVDIRVGAS